MKSELLVVGQPYPLPIPPEDGAFAEFLNPNGNRLHFFISDITGAEARAFRKGQLKCGMLTEGADIILMWQVCNERGRPLFTLDTIFDARLLESVDEKYLTMNGARLSIDVLVVDTASKEVKALRGLSMPVALTAEFMAAVKRQLASDDPVHANIQKWLALTPVDLFNQTKAHLMGT